MKMDLDEELSEKAKKELEELRDELKANTISDTIRASIPLDEFIIMEDRDLSKEKKEELIAKLRTIKNNRRSSKEVEIKLV